MAWKQKDRTIAIKTVLHTALDDENTDDVLLLRSVTTKEAVSRPFSYTCNMLSADLNREIKPTDLIGTWATITFRFKDIKTGQTISNVRSGLIRQFQVGGIIQGSTDFRVYQAEIVPWFAFLQYTTDFRIFEAMSVVEILDFVFREEVLENPRPWSKLDLFDVSKLDKSKYKTLEYCVQCRETTFDFASRLMEEYGIFYYFTHEVDSHTMVLGDDNIHFQAMDPGYIGYGNKTQDSLWDFFGGNVQTWEHIHVPGTGAWTVGDFNLAVPQEPIFQEDAPLNGFSRYHFPVQLNDVADAARVTKRRQQGEEAGFHWVSGISDNCQQFVAGSTFLFNGQSNKNGESPATYLPNEPVANYVVLEVTQTASETYGKTSFADMILNAIMPGPLILSSATNFGQNLPQVAANQPHIGDAQDFMSMLGVWSIGGLTQLVPKVLVDLYNYLFVRPDPTFKTIFKAMPQKTPFRVARLTPKPEIRGPHLALVVPAPDVNSLTCCDQFGRVRVRFPWDRTWFPWPDADTTQRGSMTAWVRVSEGWAGDGFGTMFLPRVGQEVIVEFLDGDPDRPIITGRVYNGSARPPFYEPGTTPVPLPWGPMKPESVKIQTALRQSGIRTASLPRPDNSKRRFHLLRFDDNWEKEQIVLRCQGRYDMTSFGSAYHTTHGDRHILVGGKDPDTGKGGGSLFTTTGGEYDLHVGGNRYEKVDKELQLSVTGKTTVNAEADCTVLVGGKMSLNATTIVLEASTKISLKVGCSSIVINSAGVYIDGPIIYKQCGGPVESASDATITDVADAAEADPGDPPNWLDLHPPGKSGRRKSHVVHHKAGPDCTMDNAHNMCVNLHPFCQEDPSGSSSSPAPALTSGG